MAPSTRIEDLAEQLTAASDRFVASFEKTMETEDELFTFLRGSRDGMLVHNTILKLVLLHLVHQHNHNKQHNQKKNQ